ncbi:mitochondrial coiled-coil domain protein 1 [Myotis daubentonii]|uniref:mitochondrial coiled-coil domain protein 1 n=1 Tax=Myotis daubentonii TaxID=98922 RepID=UPI00287387F5|nr:mitochondrial coiled-coil domain protein 1 [Myotis daubentonii]
MVLLLPWLSRCCGRCLLLPSRLLAPGSPQRCCSQRSKPSTKEQASSAGSGKRSPTAGPGLPAELARAEELLEQQLELAQALQEGQEGAWEAQALVLKTQKLKEQMRRLRESLGGGT